MDSFLKKIQYSISNTYFRYLTATELYMVEPWERIVIHMLFALLFTAFWYFNYNLFVSSVADLTSSKSFMEVMEEI